MNARKRKEDKDKIKQGKPVDKKKGRRDLPVAAAIVTTAPGDCGR